MHAQLKNVGRVDSIEIFSLFIKPMTINYPEPALGKYFFFF